MLLLQLGAINRLGRTGVSVQVLVEMWCAHGLEADDVFFLHFDTLLEYGFLDVARESVAGGVWQHCDRENNPAPVDNGDWGSLPALETQVSITQAGSDFLERYGNR